MSLQLTHDKTGGILTVPMMTGGHGFLCIGGDFGDCTVRIAYYHSPGGWALKTVPLKADQPSFLEEFQQANNVQRVSVVLLDITHEPDDATLPGDVTKLKKLGADGKPLPNPNAGYKGIIVEAAIIPNRPFS